MTAEMCKKKKIFMNWRFDDETSLLLNHRRSEVADLGSKEKVGAGVFLRGGGYGQFR